VCFLNPNPFLGVLYHWTGGLSAASCYLPFRGIKQWSWEIYWLVQGVFSWLIAPVIFAGVLVPGLVGILHGAAGGTIFYAWFWGAMWGVGGLLFGLGVRYLGIALGYTIALGFSTAFGTLVPPIFAGEFGAIAREWAGQVILIGVGVCMAAIVVSGIAGHMKERELAAAHAAADSGVREFSFGRGILVASFAGIFSACFAYGLAAGKPISDVARVALVAQGKSDLWQHLPALVVVLWGGFTTNFLWCGGLLLKNRTGGQFFGGADDGGARLGVGRMILNYGLAGAAGLLWYLQFFFYSMGQTKMGRYDFSSWTLHMAGTILFATLWGVVLHEWRGTSRKTRVMGGVGFGLLVLSTLVVGYGNYLKSR
jgi:L-rhamnose-H+ transport protein